MFAKRPTLPTLCLIALVFAVGAAPATAESHEKADPNVYTIDTGHTDIGFKVRHFMVSTVRGDFGEFQGKVRYNPDDLADSGVKVVIEAASIDTGHEQRDGHLKSADFLDVENHPQLLFKSTKIEQSGDGFEVTGELTIRGVTREVSFPITMAGPIMDPLGMMRFGIEGELTIDRREWGLEWNKPMEAGGVIVGHDVKIEIAAEAARKPDQS